MTDRLWNAGANYATDSIVIKRKEDDILDILLITRRSGERAFPDVQGFLKSLTELH
jgi:hypothetical protein